MTVHKQASEREVIGLVPAGGQATRLAPLPCSKELYPVGFQAIEADGRMRPKVVSHYLLERMHLSGINKAYFILRPGKWDIPAYFEDGAMLGLKLAYLIVTVPYGVPYTLDQAYPFVQDSLVALGFPDILFHPADSYTQLRAHQSATRADVVLGLFPAPEPEKMDMVEVDSAGRVQRLVIKPSQTELRDTWIIALWTPTFTRFMHDYVAAVEERYSGREEGEAAAPEELYVGNVIQAAIHEELYVEAVRFPHGACLDIGTPEALVSAVQRSDW